MPTDLHRHRLGGRDLFLVSLIALAWAGNFITAKLALMEFPPLLFTGLRLALLALCQRDRAGEIEHYLNDTLGAL